MADGTIKILTDLSADGFKKGLSQLGGIAKSGLSVVTAALGAAGAASTKLGSDFEHSMSKASTLFGDVQVDTANLKTKVLELSSSTGLAADTIGNSLYNALSAGIPVSEDMGEAMDYMGKNADLARAGFTDIDTAVTATAKVLNAYKMDVSETDKVHKVLMATQNKGITTVGELGAVLAQVTPTAAAMNVSFEQVGAALATMTAQGTPTAQATTQLNSLFAELGKQGTIANKSLMDATEGTKYAGIGFQDLMAAGVPLNEVLDLMGVNADMSDQSLLDMFGSLEAGKAALAMSGKNSEQFATNLAEMSTSADLVGDAVAKMDDTLQVRTAKMVESLKNIGIAAYDHLQLPLKEAVQAGTEYIGQLQKAIEENGIEGAVSVLGNIFADVATQIAQATPVMIDAAVSAIQGFISGIQNNLSKISDAAVSFLHSLVNGILALLPEVVAMGSELLVSLTTGIAEALPKLIPSAVECITQLCTELVDQLPLLLDAGLQIITGLTQGILDALPTLIAQLPLLIDGIINFMVGAIPQLIQAVISIVNAIVENLPTIIQAIITALPQIIQSVVTGLLSCIDQLVAGAIQLVVLLVTHLPEIIAGLISAIPAIITALANGFLSGIAPLVSAGKELIMALLQGMLDAWSTIVNFFTVTVPEAWNSFLALFSGIPEWWNGIWTAVGQFFSDCWTAIVNFFTVTIPAVIQSAIQWFEQLPYNIGLALGTAIATVIQFGIDAWNWVTTEVPKIIEGIVTFFAELPGKLWAWLCETLNKVIEWGAQTLESATTAAMNAVTAVVDWFSQLPGELWNWLCEAVNKIVEWGSQTLENAKTAASNAVTAVVDWFAQLPEKLWTWLTSTVDKIVSFGADMLTKATEAASNTVNGILEFFQGLPEQMLTIGSNIVSGIWNGISGAAGWLWEQVSGFCSGIIDGIKDFFGIHSPSKLMGKEVGRFLPPGIADGFDSTTDKAEDQMKKSLDGITSELAPDPIPIDIASQIRSGGALAQMRAAVEAESARIVAQTKVQISTHLSSLHNDLKQLIAATKENKPNNEGLVAGVSEAIGKINVEIDGKRLAAVTSPLTNRNFSAQAKLDRRHA